MIMIAFGAEEGNTHTANGNTRINPRRGSWITMQLIVMLITRFLKHFTNDYGSMNHPSLISSEYLTNIEALQKSFVDF